MKIPTILAIAALSISIAHADIDQIRTQMKVIRDGKVMQEPALTALSGTPSQFAITEDQKKGEAGSPPVGMILDSKTELKDGKVKYSCLLTLRERSDSQHGADQTASVYKTTEFYLSGTAEAGKDIKTDLGNGLVVSLHFTKVPLVAK